jgi:HSP20 family protein
MDMALVPWRPFGWGLRRWGSPRGISTIEEEIDDLFNRFERVFGRRRGAVETRGWGPPIDMINRKDEVLVRAELPGLKKEHIHVSVTGDVLTVEGERKADEEVKDDDYYCCEHSYGRFYREISLPAGVQKEKITSSYRDGILEIHLPKAEEAKPKELEIKVS